MLVAKFFLTRAGKEPADRLCAANQTAQGELVESLDGARALLWRLARSGLVWPCVRALLLRCCAWAVCSVEAAFGRVDGANDDD